MGLVAKIDHMVDVISLKRVIPRHGMKPFIKVHYTAICYHENNGEFQIFIAKKKHERKWRFGGSIMYHTYSYIGTIKQHYQDTFALDIDIINDKQFNNPTPLILTTYTYYETNDTPRKGTALLAEIKADLENIQCPEDWDIRLLTLEELIHFNEPCIKGFKRLLKNVLDILEHKYSE
ncbi:hypothetical protein [Chakrabartyella piscis]|uniref:hypothetical protein n=1 Tax=Chakrabartyella piscis TaxID=2918914 RepID=UPI002958D0A5|nr:hypothetical protein [Chakrabartyella piscis]